MKRSREREVGWRVPWSGLGQGKSDGDGLVVVVRKEQAEGRGEGAIIMYRDMSGAVAAGPAAIMLSTR